MAIVADSHHPWAFTFGILGNLVSTMVYLAPVSTFYRIYRKKSTEGFHSVPYVVALFSSMLWFYYALLKKNAMLLITINSFGSMVEIIYIIMFIVYAPKETRKSTVRLFGFMNVGLFSLILFLSHFLVRSAYRVTVLGWVNVAVSVSVFAAPLSILAQVIRTRSVEFMPFSLTFFLTLSAVMWFAYGMFLKDICIAIPNVLGFFLGLLQMLLYAIYRNRQVIIEDHEKKLAASAEHVKNLVVIATLGTSEVHPVDAPEPHNCNDNVNDDAKEHEHTNEDNDDSEKSVQVAAASHVELQPNESSCAV